jgi:hypothetical protein
MTQAKIGYQTFLQRGDGAAPENFNSIIEITSIKGPGAKVDMKDATSMSSPGQVKEIIAGLEDPGQVQLTVNWVPGDPQHRLLLADKSNKTLKNFKVVLPPAIGLTWTFAGLVSAFEPDYPLDDKIVATIMIDISGPATLA